MAKQVINREPPDSGEGDSLYAAFGKVIANFDELYALVAALQISSARIDANNNFTGKMLTNFTADVTVATVTGNTFTPPLGDAGAIREIDNAAPVDLVLPADRPKGYSITLVQMNAAGPLVWRAASGASVSLRPGSAGHTKTAGVEAHITAYVRSNSSGANAAWVVGGDTIP